MTAPHWEPVEHFAAASPGEDLIAAVEMVVPSVTQRYLADDGSRAIVVPLELLPRSSVSSSEAPASTQVVFIDPPTVSATLSALAEQLMPQPVWIALPERTDRAGVIEEVGRLSIVAGPAGTTVYGLFELLGAGEEQHARLAAAPKIGESADVLDKRSKWFEAREGKQN